MQVTMYRTVLGVCVGNQKAATIEPLISSGTFLIAEI
jgi:hypothetical protein